MSLQVSPGEVVFEPGPVDVHAHPRIFDPISRDQFVPENHGLEGKAGLDLYTSVALRSGITAMLAMPNEHMRLYEPREESRTKTMPYPISNLDRVRAVEAAISAQAHIPTGLILGVDPVKLFYDAAREVLKEDVLHQNFEATADDVMALKLYGDETTGGFNIPPAHIPLVAKIWHEHNPDKPVIMHLEDENVGRVLLGLYDMPGGADIPVHIAHVSSRQELEWVMHAKSLGMNVTCEVTPHHLFLDESVLDQIGGYGCMKPSLKTKDDIAFIWGNLGSVDILASDCAPHRPIDKQGESTAYGVTNHLLMLKLLLGAVADGRLTYNDIYQKFCLTPRERFNLPADESSVRVDVGSPVYSSRTMEDRVVGRKYLESPFHQLDLAVSLDGLITYAQGGRSAANETSSDIGMTTRYAHLIRPNR